MEQLIKCINDSELGIDISLSPDQILFLVTKELIRLRSEVDELKSDEPHVKRSRVDYDSDSSGSTIIIKDKEPSEKVLMKTRDGGQHEVIFTGQNISFGKSVYQVVRVAGLSRLYSVRPGKMIVPLTGVQLRSLNKAEDD